MLPWLCQCGGCGSSQFRDMWSLHIGVSKLPLFCVCAPSWTDVLLNESLSSMRSNLMPVLVIGLSSENIFIWLFMWLSTSFSKKIKCYKVDFRIQSYWSSRLYIASEERRVLQRGSLGQARRTETHWLSSALSCCRRRADWSHQQGLLCKLKLNKYRWIFEHIHKNAGNATRASDDIQSPQEQHAAL